MFKKKILGICMLLALGLTACGTQEAETESAVGSIEDVEVATGSLTVVESEEVVADESDDQDYYKVFTSRSKDDVENTIANFKETILSRDWNGVAGILYYPITIDGKEYKSEEEFLAVDWDNIMTQNFVEELEKETCVDIHCNSQGACLCGGQIWVTTRTDENGEEMLKIISFSPF